ncbi:thioredoxin [Pseudomonas protegens]|uniref:Thioredoxin family protein n=3 Tax=Pseudomonas TaxID=286 RepID=A0ABY2VIN4_9PSED|nr:MULTISPECIES: thioredoxin family protein [Pseudomonas]GED74612.1 thiol reductase thioredoxin [Pseudomonas fluorescens]AAY93528.1 putative lipoprotein [Pseudomonas protegens Pf-5]APC21839.1 thioredoxin [Pseudomonas protegens]AQT11213.1 lipoprotein [Pseudomonas protegens]ASE22306.1 thioredoxin [Pseudomonas protegens]
MTADSECRPFDIVSPSIVLELELTDFDIDQQLLGLGGVSLVVFTSVGCSSCRWARARLPELELPIDRLCWVDAGDNGGAVQRYQVFHLPALFVVRDGEFHGALQSRLTQQDLSESLRQALNRIPEELP